MVCHDSYKKFHGYVAKLAENTKIDLLDSTERLSTLLERPGFFFNQRLKFGQLPVRALITFN